MLRLVPQPMARSERIRFRCWKCQHRFGVTRTRVGETIQCDCGEDVRVPRWDHGNCRVRTLVAKIVETILFGFGSALVGLVAAVCVLPRLGHVPVPPVEAAIWVIGASAVGILLGGPAVDIVGTMIRARQRD
jgi:hypothetical protein